MIVLLGDALMLKWLRLLLLDTVVHFVALGQATIEEFVFLNGSM